MVRSYLRHGPTEAFGLICSSSSNSIWDGKLAYVPALEDVLVWDVKKGQMLSLWHETGHRAEVTCIEQSPDKNTFAVGYADGSIRLWSAHAQAVTATFNGHRKAVTALCFDHAGVRLASGSQDTDIILWDVVGEAGLFRLRGHRDQITGMRFLSVPTNTASSSSSIPSADFLVSTAKDTLMKLWDLSTQHCVQTLVAHPTEVWTLAVNSEQDLILTGGSEGELKAWKIYPEVLAEGLKETESGEILKAIHFEASLPLSTKHRVAQILFHPKQPILAVHSHDKTVDILRVRTPEEIRKKQARRKRREREKAKTKTSDKAELVKGDELEKADDAMDVENEKISLVDLFTPYLVVRANGKIRSLNFSEETDIKGAAHLLTALSTNSLEVHSIPAPAKGKDEVPESSRIYSLELPGHRTDVRTLCVSSDDQLLASASNGSLKIWNLKTTSCLRTMECPYAICSTFLPGDRQVAIGTKSGELVIFDLASSSMQEPIKAHSSTIWSMHLRPDGQGLITGSADKDVKFWEFDWDANSSNFTPRNIRAFKHVRTLKMTDDILSVRYSPNGKLLAVSLLDSTVKIFYQDTLKFFLSLYGHKLPVLSMDISDDSKLIVTCSADKNVKIWGLDFGDCHKSIFAHDESIMQIAFEKGSNSHYFWTVGKDKFLKYWDGDKFENIQKLEGHHGEIWALAVSHHGKFVVTGSHDKSIRIWEKLDEPLFLEEERERELEQLYERGLVESMNHMDQPIGSGAPDADGTVEPGAEATAVSKQTSETLMDGERIIEALELADAELAAYKAYEEAKAKLSAQDAEKLPAPSRNAILAAYDLEPDQYVLSVVEKISNTALLDALLVLPFGNVLSLMLYLNKWAERGQSIPLVSRIMVFLLKTHHRQVVTHRALRTSLVPLRRHLRGALAKQKEIVGYNLAALRYLKRQEEYARTTTFLNSEDIIKELREKAADAEVKKRKRIVIQA